MERPFDDSVFSFNPDKIKDKMKIEDEEKKEKKKIGDEERIKKLKKQIEYNRYLLNGILGTYSCFEINNILQRTEEELKNFEERITKLGKKHAHMDVLVEYIEKAKKEEKNKENI